MWQSLAAQALGAVLQQGITNAMSKDYAPGNTAAPWYKKILTGPTEDRTQYTQEQMAKRESDQLDKRIKANATEGAADRENARYLQQQRDKSEMDRFGKTFGLEQQQLAQKQLNDSADVLMRGKALDIQSNPPIHPQDVNHMVTSMAGNVYETQMKIWNQQAAQAKLLNQPVPPPPTIDDAVSSAAAAVRRMMSIPQSNVAAPGVPLVSSDSLF